MECSRKQQTISSVIGIAKKILPAPKSRGSSRTRIPLIAKPLIRDAAKAVRSFIIAWKKQAAKISNGRSTKERPQARRMPGEMSSSSFDGFVKSRINEFGIVNTITAATIPRTKLVIIP